ncbi:uncharacterized protein LOC105326236 [Rhizophagus clarus]|uniref:Uncharacterized protein LOC105326236 n=1 Tax=Rhizophagus clarus TaxID=94130 RepID=A0A8H3KW77_9GLOM|nr:uncharacterized protein LOC105326236 [Rhizophagus clarus]
MAVKYKEYSNLVFLDDKHRCKVDHDFTKCGLIPSVIIHADIPESIDESFYHSTVHVDLKDPIFELSNGGEPDHQVKYIKTQLLLISLFLSLDLDYLVAVHIPPGHSWKNLVERIISILNLELQCVGLIRQEMDAESEEIMSQCNSMSDIRKAAEKNPSLKENLKQSLNFTITLLNKPISEFFSHCYHSHSYFFSIKKCGKDDCEICLPIRSSQHIFDTLNHLPDPIPANNEHSKSFNDVYDKQMPWTGNGQKAKNVGMTVTCMDCNKSRCLYASKKLADDDKKILTSYLDTICYTCGVTFNNYYDETEGNFFEESSRKRCMKVLDDDDDDIVLSDMESDEEIE